MALKPIKPRLKQNAMLFLKIEPVGKIRDGSNIEYEEVGVAFKTRVGGIVSNRDHTNKNNKINSGVKFYVAPDFVGNEYDKIVYKSSEYIISEIVERIDDIGDKIHHLEVKVG